MSYNAMLRSNNEIRNHEGAKAWMQTPEFELYSTVVCTMSLDDKFYESGSDRVNRIASLVRMVLRHGSAQAQAEYVAQLAIYARMEMHLRSVPMLLLVELSQCHSGDSLVSRATAKTIQRVDDITELLSCYQWRHRSNDLKHLSHQLRKGIAQAFNKFDEYQFAKYNGGNKKVTLSDALFIAHPKAKDEAQQRLFDKIAHNELNTSYTWETQLSKAGQEKALTPEQRKEKKRETWKELIESRRMGYMAMLRNLRNMLSTSVDRGTMQIVYDYLSNEQAVKNSKQLPFRFFSAYLMMTGHVVQECSWPPLPTPYDGAITELQEKHGEIRAKLHELQYRTSCIKVRKVSKKRVNVSRSRMLQVLKEVGLLEGLLHPWHVAKTHLRTLLHTKMSHHLRKYVHRLKISALTVRKQLRYYGRCAEKYRQTHTSDGRVHSQKPFFAPQVTLDCLETAVRHSASNIPAFSADTRVCIACDTSGSMMTPVGGSSVMECYDLALFFGVMMKYRCQDAVVGMFGDTWLPIDMPADDIMKNVLKMRKLMGRVGYSTNGHKVIEWLMKFELKMDKVMMFTDCQLWDSEFGDANLSSAWHEYKRTIAPDAKLYLFDLEGYGQDPIDVDNEKDVYCIAGWSDKLFDMLAALENGKSVIDEIRRIVV